MRVTLVIARYSEDIGWLLECPDNIDIIIYNKGEEIQNLGLISRAKRIESRRNFGREAETYLHHMLSVGAGGDDGMTIFCQGDPFPHSPDFLELLKYWDEWEDIQPLSVRWLESRQIPPDLTLAMEQEEYLRGLRIRSEIFSLHTWSPVKFHDEAAMQVGRGYLSGHQLPLGTNIAAHFLQSVGLDSLARKAGAADFGQSCHGAIFALRNRLLSGLSRDVLLKCQGKSRAHPVYGYIFERLWLHFFGLPFHPKVVRHRSGVAVCETV